MKKLLMLALTFLIIQSAYATLTVTRVPVTKTGGSSPVLQNGSITDLGTASGPANVGIGSTNPGQALDVQGTIRILSGSLVIGANNILATQAGNLTASGNVGIGTFNPGTNLDVQGTIRTTALTASILNATSSTSIFGFSGSTANLGSNGVTTITDGSNSAAFRFAGPTFNPADNILTLVSPGPQNAFGIQSTAPIGFSALVLHDMFNNENGAFYEDNADDAVVMGYQSGTVLTVTSVVSSTVVLKQTLGVVTGTPGSYVLTANTLNDSISSLGTGTGGTGTYNMSVSATIGSSGTPVQLALIAGGDGLEISNLSSVASSFPPTFDLRQSYQPGGSLTEVHALDLDASSNMHLLTGVSCNGTNEDLMDLVRTTTPWVGICAGATAPASGVNFTVGRGGSIFTRGTSFDGSGAAGADLLIGGTTAATLRFSDFGVFRYDIIANTSPNRLDFVDTTGGVTPFSLAQDGTKTVTMAGPTKYTGAVVSAPSTGGTVTFATNQRLAILNPAGTLATLTVQLPSCASASDGDERTFSTTQILTALTISASAGSIGSGSATTASAGQGHTYHCVGSSATWYQIS